MTFTTKMGFFQRVRERARIADTVARLKHEYDHLSMVSQSDDLRSALSEVERSVMRAKLDYYPEQIEAMALMHQAIEDRNWFAYDEAGAAVLNSQDEMIAEFRRIKGAEKLL